MALVGRIARAHGNRGQVIIDSETDFPHERFRPGAELFVGNRDGARPLTLTCVRFHRDRPIVGFAGVETMDAAEALSGTELRVPIEKLAPPPQGAFYRHDLVGCRVETRAGGAVGVVRGVEGTLDNSRLVVGAAGGDVLIPFVSAICTAIDTAARRIVIDPPGGLLDLNR